MPSNLPETIPMPRNGFTPFTSRFFALPIVAGLLASTLLAADAQSATGKQWAIMIGCEDYTKAAKLQFTVNDVTKLAALGVEYELEASALLALQHAVDAYRKIRPEADWHGTGR